MIKSAEVPPGVEPAKVPSMTWFIRSANRMSSGPVTVSPRSESPC